MHFNGRNPTSKCGEYFGNNDQWWGQVDEYCKMVAPEIYALWSSNDGDGLDTAAAVALGDALQKEVDSGRTETFAGELASLLPNYDCEFCGGTGMRTLFSSRVANDLKEGETKREGAGHVRPRTRNYPFSTENVAAFAAFLRESGGFR
jgi:hypothetical protein